MSERHRLGPEAAFLRATVAAAPRPKEIQAGEIAPAARAIKNLFTDRSRSLYRGDREFASLMTRISFARISLIQSAI